MIHVRVATYNSINRNPANGNFTTLSIDEYCVSLAAISFACSFDHLLLNKHPFHSLSFNRMSGEIPTDLESIPTLLQLHLNGQRDSGGFTGRVPSFKNSEHLHDIDLSKNSLTGSIHNDFLQTVRESGRHQDYAYSTINL